MAAFQRVSTPRVVLNNQTIFIVANSLSYTDGKGERSVTAQSAGNGVSSIVFAENAETFMSMVKFKILPTASNIDILDTARNNLSNNVIVIDFQDGSGETRSFTNMTITNNPEYALGQDQDIEVEFQGDPAV
jgi:hypothetical protein